MKIVINIAVKDGYSYSRVFDNLKSAEKTIEILKKSKKTKSIDLAHIERVYTNNNID